MVAAVEVEMKSGRLICEDKRGKKEKSSHSEIFFYLMSSAKPSICRDQYIRDREADEKKLGEGEEGEVANFLIMLFFGNIELGSL